MNSSSVLSISIVSVTGVLCLTASAASYTIDGIIPNGYAYGISSSGSVAGVFQGSPAYYDSEGLKYLDPAHPGFTGSANGINSSGVVVGSYGGPVFLNGTLQGVPGNVGPYGSANGVNDSGLIVGKGYYDDGAGHQYFEGFTYNGSTLTQLPSPWGGGNLTSGANGVSSTGIVVGTAVVSGIDQNHSPYGSEHAFSYDGTMHDLGTLPGLESFSSEAYAINDHGVAVGNSDGAIVVGALYMNHAVKFENGTVQDLGTLGNPLARSVAYGINNSDVIVGTAEYDPEHAYHAFVNVNGVMEDLNNDLVDASGWNLVEARGINDAGQIVGWGYSPTGVATGFLLTPTEPVPEASTWAAAAALSLMAAAQWHRRCPRR